MSMKLKVSAGGVPAGAYSAKFLGFEAVPNDPTKGYGAGIRWQFEVVAGQHTGSKAGRITNATPTAKNACGKMLSGLTGKALKPGEEVDLGQFVGKVYLIVVQDSDGGGSRVETVSVPPI
jgi:hypothetical protein